MSLTNLDRRTIGHLGQPRSVTHLAQVLTQDEHTYTQDHRQVHEGKEVYDRLLALRDRGLVVNLGEKIRPNDAVRTLPPDAFELHDDSRRLFTERLKHPSREWRMHGDLWILSKEGLESVKDDSDAPPPLTPSQVQLAVDKEWARTLEPNATPDSYAGVLTQEEFTTWAKAVAEDCENRWGTRPLLPIAGGASGWSNAYENSLIDGENQKGFPTTTDPFYMALTILAFTDTDTGTTADDGSHVPTYTGYARKSVAASDMGAAASGTGANGNAIAFAACTVGSSTILGGANCVASTVGVLRKYFTVSSTTISTTQTPATFDVGAYTTSAD